MIQTDQSLDHVFLLLLYPHLITNQFLLSDVALVLGQVILSGLNMLEVLYYMFHH